MYLQEAFRALDALNEDTFSVSDDGINKLAEFQNNDDLEDEIKVIDPDAETEEDLQDSYVGKVILDCSVCHSKLYKDKEEVELDEEGVMANVGEECPYCYTSDGFKVIGEVAAFGKAEEDDNKVEESLSETPSKEEITDPKSEEKTDTLTEAYEDTQGIMGEKGTKWTEDQLKTYFDSEKDNDPVLKAYNGNADKWLQDTTKGMKRVNEDALNTRVVKTDKGFEITNDWGLRSKTYDDEQEAQADADKIRKESKSIKESGGAGFRLSNSDILDIEDLADAVYKDDEEYIKKYVAKVNKDINVKDLSTAAENSDYPREIKNLIAHMKNKGYNTIGDFSKALNESKSIKQEECLDEGIFSKKKSSSNGKKGNHDDVKSSHYVIVSEDENGKKRLYTDSKASDSYSITDHTRRSEQAEPYNNNLKLTTMTVKEAEGIFGDLTRLVKHAIKNESVDIKEAAFSGGVAGDSSFSGGTVRGMGASTQPSKKNYLDRLKSKNPELVDIITIKGKDIKPGMITNAGQVKEAKVDYSSHYGKNMVYIMHTNNYDGFWDVDEDMPVMADPDNKSEPFVGSYRDLLSKGLEESVKVNGENLSYAVINPDGSYAGAPCTSEEEARELAAQKEGRVVVKLEAVKNESKSVNESVNNVNVETDDSIVNVSTDDNGKVTVTTEPNEAPAEAGDEIIAPVSPETQAEIEGGSETDEGSEDTTSDDEFVDMEVDEFDEESFDGLGESYLKKVYENVDSYKTTSIKENGNSIVVEGVINFKSGKSGKTSFLFEAKDCTKDGRVRFVGENAQLTKGKKSFTISGKVTDKKFIAESFNYNYRAKDKDGKSSRIYGTIKK